MRYLRADVLVTVVAVAAIGIAPEIGLAQWAAKSPRDLASEKAILKAIDQPSRGAFHEQPLYECIWAFGHELKIPMAFDTAALTDVGITTDRPTTFAASGVSARAALDQMLRAFDLTWVIEDETLMIIPRDAELKHLEIRIYQVSDLVAAKTPRETVDNLDDLFELITSMINPTSWENVGGVAAIWPLDNRLALAAYQTHRNHEQIALLLETIRALDRTATPRNRDDNPSDEDGEAVAVSHVRRNRGAEMRFLGIAKPTRDVAREEVLLAALERPVYRRFNALPLEECVRVLESELQIPIALDRYELNNMNISVERSITFTSDGLTARAALAGMLHDLQLSWLIKDETVMITSSDEVNRNLEIRVYPVRDLVLPEDGARRPADFESLINLVTDTVRPTSWDSVGGAGSIKGHNATLSLVVNQTREVHEQLELLLAQMRAVGGWQNIRPFNRQIVSDATQESLNQHQQPVALAP